MEVSINFILPVKNINLAYIYNKLNIYCFIFKRHYEIKNNMNITCFIMYQSSVQTGRSEYVLQISRYGDIILLMTSECEQYFS